MVRVVIENATTWTTVLIGVGAGVVTGVSAVIVGQLYENKRWGETQRMLIRSGQADRLRNAFGRMAQASASLQAILAQRSFVITGEPVAERDARHMREINEALAHVAKAGGLILIEPTAQKVSDAYRRVANLMTTYLSQEQGLPAGSDRMEKLNQTAEQLSAAALDVVDQARKRVSKWDEPPRLRSLPWNRRGVRP